MIYGKIGTTELLALEFGDRVLRMPWPKRLSWQRQADRLFHDSGVFPATRRQFDAFLQIYRSSVASLDGISLWQETAFLQEYERAIASELCPAAQLLSPDTLSPFFMLGLVAEQRWLVISPFVKSMQKQVVHLEKVFSKFDWSVRLKGMETRCRFLRCPFFSYLEASPYRDWSEGLYKLTEAALREEFDIALVGAGAWSLPLLGNLKKAGKKGIHLGGSTQVAFGIQGKRWDGYWSRYYNDCWIRPLSEDTPAGHEQKEDGCYW
jgi:hypothetical protein